MTDNAAWEKAERERFEAWWSQFTDDGTVVEADIVWLAKARQARDDYDFAGQAVKDAARLERELATETKLRKAAEVLVHQAENVMSYCQDDEQKWHDDYRVWKDAPQEKQDV